MIGSIFPRIHCKGVCCGQEEAGSLLCWRSEGNDFNSGGASDAPIQFMTCPFCGHLEDRVIDSRESREGDSIRRRRQCDLCEKRFTTYERIDEVPYMVIKKDGRREKFDRQKVLNGLLKACEKRPVGMAKLSDMVNQVEARVTDSPDREISTTEVGEYLMDVLRGLDKIAYVRFASVYRDFQDEQAFLNELKSLTRTFPGGGAPKN
jgi:transcriptional repressor NrdR